jgi:hypothetical protein
MLVMSASEGITVPEVRDLDLGLLADPELHTLALLVGAEQQRRALLNGDVTALTEEGYREGFGPAPAVQDPWVRDGMLIAPGGRFERGAHTHRCSFVKVDNQWVWEHANKVSDEIRRGEKRDGMRSVTLVALSEGSRVDLVSARSRNGLHTATAVRSFLYKGGMLELVNSRLITDLQHR